MKIFTSTTKAMLLSLFAGVVFFCLYWTTLNDGFFPGEAARCLRRAAMIFPLCVRDETVTAGEDGTVVLPAECDDQGGSRGKI